jgi:hypothetical protein
MIQMTFLQYRTKLVPQVKIIKVLNSTFMNMTEETLSINFEPHAKFFTSVHFSMNSKRLIKINF